MYKIQKRLSNLNNKQAEIVTISSVLTETADYPKFAAITAKVCNDLVSTYISLSVTLKPSY